MELQTVQFERKFTDNGYIKILTDDGWKLEHIYVVEKFIGRELTKEERVHHQDQCKQNNVISNLYLFPNTKSHSHYHRQLKQFNFTTPRRLELQKIREYMINERIKNYKQ